MRKEILQSFEFLPVERDLAHFFGQVWRNQIHIIRICRYPAVCFWIHRVCFAWIQRHGLASARHPAGPAHRRPRLVRILDLGERAAHSLLDARRFRLHTHHGPNIAQLFFHSPDLVIVAGYLVVGQYDGLRIETLNRVFPLMLTAKITNFAHCLLL